MKMQLRITGGFVVDQSNEDISDFMGLIDVAIATKFWPNRPRKSQKNVHNFSCMQHIHAEFGFEIGFVLP